MPNLLDDARYISLLSFKRDGGEAKTPVWAASIDSNLGIYTDRDSYKVKRIRRNPAVRVARCDVRGKVVGPWYEGSCVIVEDEARKKAIFQALSRKYGWQVNILNFLATVTGRLSRRAYLEVTLKEAP